LKAHLSDVSTIPLNFVSNILNNGGMKHRILIVDDEEASRQILSDLTESLGYEVETAEDGEEALALTKLGINLIIADLKMPGMDGYELLSRIRSDTESQNLPVIVITGLNDADNRSRSFEAGANDFIPKPVNLAELRTRISTHLTIQDLKATISRHQDEMESTIEDRTNSLRITLEEVVEARRANYQAYKEMIYRLGVAAEMKDKDTASHIDRVSRYCAILAEAAGLSPGEVEVISFASPMHDVGKIGVPDQILLKPGPLDPEEWNIMKQHTVYGARLLSDSSSDLLSAGELMALTHHEKWDGSGYPEGLAGEEIPLMGRICALADVFDAMTNTRPYQESMSNEYVLDFIRKEKGTHFDPDILDLFYDNEGEVVAIQKEYPGRQ